MDSKIFRLGGYRDGGRQYYYMIPVIDENGNLVEESYRKHTQDCNEWSEPDCWCWHRPGIRCCTICEKPSVFRPCLYGVPENRKHQNEEWRRDFNEKNYGSFWRIWGNDGNLVRINAVLTCCGGGTLSRVECAYLSPEVEAACKS